MREFRAFFAVLAAAVAALVAFGAAVFAQDAGPYQAVTLPDRIEAEHYDSGESGVAWSDTDAHAGSGSFRVDDDVDAFEIERVGASGQALLGRTRDGEFVQYTVEVADADEFEIRLQVASGADAPGVIHVDVDGARVGTVDGDTDGWFQWTARTAGTVALDAGTHVVQLTWADGANVNLDWIDFRSTTPQPAQCDAGVLEAEDATIAGRFGAGDFDQASGGSAVGVERGAGGFFGGVGDSYVEFCTSVATAGEYRIDARLLAPAPNKTSFFVSIDDGPLVDFVADQSGDISQDDFGTFVVNDARGLDPLYAKEAPTPVVEVATWQLEPGDHTVRFYLRRDGVFLDTMTLAPVDAPTCLIFDRVAPSNLDQQSCDRLDRLINETVESTYANKRQRPAYAGDPCDWPGVTCDDSGSNVTGLDLVLPDRGEFPSLVLDFPELMHLALDSATNETLSIVLPARIGELTNLKTLKLNGTELAELPAEFGKLTNLETLDLDDNELTELPVEIGSLRALTTLDVSNNELDGDVSAIAPLLDNDGFELAIADNPCADATDPELAAVISAQNDGVCQVVPDCVNNCAPLRALYRELALPIEEGDPCDWDGIECDDTGTLRYLSLGYKDLPSLPAEIGDLTSLTELDLAANQLTALPPEFGNLVNLEVLSLGGNNRVSLPPEFANLTALFYLELTANNYEEVPPEVLRLPSLRHLDLVANPLAELPAEIGNLASLEELYLGFATPLVSLPPEIGNLSNLRRLLMFETQLTSLPPEIGNLSNLRMLSVLQSNLTSLPPEIGNLVGLKALSVQQNNLTSLPPEIGNLTNLTRLYLNDNDLTGDVGALVPLLDNVGLRPRIGGNPCATSTDPALAALIDAQNNGVCAVEPDCVGQQDCGPLVALYVELGLPVPAGEPCSWAGVECDAAGAVTKLSLRSQNLTSLPAQIGDLTTLVALDLGFNSLTTLPPEIGNLVNLEFLDLQGNELASLPPEFANLVSLERLGVEGNGLTALPLVVTSLSSLRDLGLTGNPLVELPAEIGNLVSLESLDFNVASLVSLPPEIGNLSNLSSIVAIGAQLTSLPPEIGNLTNLAVLALPENNLTSVPAEIGNLTNLTLLLLDDNDLTGDVSAIAPLLDKPGFVVGLGGNPCATSTDPALAALIDAQNNGVCAVEPDCVGQQGCGPLVALYVELGLRVPAGAPCSWAGVECDAAGAVTKLSLDRRDLAALPAEIGELTTLVTLDLGFNSLTTLPPEIGNLVNLEFLDLQGNELASLPPELGNLSNLTDLGLPGNELTTLPAAVTRLTSLRSLDLTANPLVELPAEIDNLASLESLYFNVTSLVSLPPEIGNLANLRSIVAFGAQLTSLPPEIGNLSNLASLVLPENNLASVPAEIGNLTNLTLLTLDDNDLTGDVSAIAPLLDNAGFVVGLGGNPCATSTDPALAALIDAQNSGVCQP